jgi:hypothetical protein
MQIARLTHSARRTTANAAPDRRVPSGHALRPFTRRLDDSPAKAAYLKSP